MNSSLILPVDVLHAICSFLSGFDVFRFSHTNSWVLTVLSDNLYWQKRGVGCENLSIHTWKQRYMQERSLLFVDLQSAKKYLHGMLLGANSSRLGFARLEKPPSPGKWRSERIDLSSVKDCNFSFDVWFCLFPGTEYQSTGGVIYGLQSRPASSRYPGEKHGHFIMVDIKKNLYCSVLGDAKIIAQDLKPNYWYHLALTYDVKSQQQQVYVHGKKISTEVGPLNNAWPLLKHEQIGTGYCDNTTRDQGVHLPHSRLHGGWYSFYGLIDEFRVWKDILTQETIADLACCKQPQGCSPMGSIKRDHDRRGCWINTKMVRCTRPAEGKNVVVE
ncbi:hypothetical protein P3T76_015213 [Phytophthora citrophthora]|uniref:F-box domain-containing protein n=1 Tax=Phytophthora citrophthora TaxID=4793 RepID=A0AAD9FZY3_9STRA|nr:hypothetical protein P3T76_015213 [Phytophthora citrophthora]